MDIVEACGQNAWQELRGEWTSLLDRCRSATIYQTWEWNEAWWRAFGRSYQLRILCVRDGGELVGIAPLYVSRHLGTPLRRLAFVGTGPADYLDAIAADERSTEVGRTVLRYISSTGGYDLADLQQLAPGSTLGSAAEGRSLDAAGPRVSLVAQEPCPYLPLPNAWPEYTARLGKKTRANLGYYDRLLGRTFEDVWVGIATRDDLPEGMSALFALHQQRWNARFLPGVLRGARTQAFHRTVAERFHERGWLRLHLIRIGTRTVAALYCFRFGNRYYYYLGGFAPDLSRYSLGTVLTARAVQQAISEGCAEFDFLRGDEPYKARWQPEERTNHRLLVARPGSLRCHAMLRLNRLERYVEKRAKAFAEGRGRKQPQ